MRSLFVLLSFASAFAVSAHAETLNWATSVAETSRANAELGAARGSYEAARYQTNAAYSGFLPQVSGSLDYSRSKENNAAASDGYSASLTATQNLFSGFLDRARVDQAQANAEAVSASLDTTRAKVSYDLKAAFAGLLYSKNTLRLAEDIVARRESNMRLVQLRYETGRENKGSVLLSKAYLEQAKYDRLQSANGLETARAFLARVLGRDETVGIDIAGAVPVAGPAEKIDFQSLAINTPTYRQSVAQSESADAGIVAARSQFFPTLNVTGTSARTGQEFFPGTPRWSLGVGVKIPLFTGGKDFYTTKAATQTWKAAEGTRENTLREALVSLRSAEANYREAVQKLEVDRAFRDATEARERIATQKYNNGLLTFDDWDIIENDLIARQKAFLQSERDRVVAEAAWEQAQGKGVVP